MNNVIPEEVAVITTQLARRKGIDHRTCLEVLADFHKKSFHHDPNTQSRPDLQTGR
jgi:arabinogalactan endo-1,4-beta-galactosidase